VFDNGHEKTYKYNDAGERVIKRGPQGETAYVNQFFTVRNREIGTKHVFVGTTRFVSKLVKNSFERDQYFFHPDHLGSTSYVTDAQGKIYEHLEYFPFGETWVQEATNTQRTPYLFTGKELDEETGLYYYGARYYDPRTSLWQSPDPVLDQYLDEASNASMYQSINLDLYGYSRQNPIRYFDPDGNRSFKPDYSGATVYPAPKDRYSDRAPKSQISIIVVHGTGTSAKAVNRRTAEQVVNNTRASVHYVIDRKGHIVQSVPESKRAHHAGESNYNRRPKVNNFSIGIELVHGNQNTPDLPLTDEQENSLMDLLIDIVQRHPTIKDIVGHRDIAPHRKPHDPPSNVLDFNQLREEINERLEYPRLGSESSQE
jgi:RHS repeat-associated protein